MITEREKMSTGEWYNYAHDEELQKKKKRAVRLCYKFNHAEPESEERKEVMTELLGELPEEFDIMAPVGFDYGFNTRFGKGVFVNHGCYFKDSATIEVGENTFIGPNCTFYTAEHPLKYALRNKGYEKAIPIWIGDNCWLAGNVTVMPGVRIGNGVVVAAGSLVTKNIPDNCIVAGVPAAIKKFIDQ